MESSAKVVGFSAAKFRGSKVGAIPPKRDTL